MKRDIDGKTYDTAAARLIASHEVDTTHTRRVTALYRSAGGDFFLVEEHETHGQDGALLLPFTDDMALKWLETRGKRDIAEELFRDKPATVVIEIDRHMLRAVTETAEAAGRSRDEWVTAAIEAALAGRTEPV
jgi:hypothetical protein